MAIYERFLKERSNVKRVLILGSTPELRQLAAVETDATIYVADQSFTMLEEMLKLSPAIDPSHEIWIKEDWATLSLPQKFFDVILGDVVLHQLTPKRERAFLEHMRSLLTDDGVYITRLFFLDRSAIAGDIPTIVSKVSPKSYSPVERRTLLLLQVLWLYADLEARTLDRQRCARDFEHYIRDRSIQDPVLVNVRDILIADRNLYRNWSAPNRQDLFSLVSEAFSLQESATAGDYPVARYFPIVCLSPHAKE